MEQRTDAIVILVTLMDSHDSMTYVCKNVHDLIDRQSGGSTTEVCHRASGIFSSPGTGERLLQGMGDTTMDASAEQILIITGPNMAGKSTFLRQTALIVLMA